MRPPRAPAEGAPTPTTAAAAPTPAPAPTATPSPPPPRLRLAEATWNDLPGWSEDHLSAAAPALLRSCVVWRTRDRETPVGDGAVAGKIADWLPLCDELSRAAGDDASVRSLLTTRLRPVAISNNGEAAGLFTGYYEPSLRGSRTATALYRVPLYVRPPELVSVDLGRFRADLKGKRIAGRVEDGVLVPYFDRAAIDQGALAGRGLELLWVDDPVDAFFLEIQGSGRVTLPDGTEMRVGYAGQNGFVYTAVGRELVTRGALARDQVSMQSIRDWLVAHPDDAASVLRTNASYVFFRMLSGEGPPGSFGVVLTPERSLAVDPTFVPLGIPVWVDTTFPAPTSSTAAPLRRLLVAQDTGGAITGPVRGDVFWGHGERAADLAGRMRQPGRMWMLLPKTVTLPAP